MPAYTFGMLDSSDEFRVAGTQWFLDARFPRPRSIVSHGHSDHLGRHQLTLATPVTTAILRHRLFEPEEASSTLRELELDARPDPSSYIELNYAQPYEADDARIELFPAGHVLGSAMARVTTDAGSILYTGDFRLHADALTVPHCTPVHADTLLMECTYGLPRYRFQPRAQVVSQLCDLLAATQAAGKQPILLCYSLGKAQELTAHLSRNGFAVSLHGAAFAISEIYRQASVELGNYRTYAAGEIEGTVLIVPPHCRNARMITNIKNAEIFVITGWGLDQSAKYRYQAQHAIAISDHADFDELNAFIDAVNPRQVLLTHGFVKEFCSYLRGRGIHAQPAKPPKQMALFEM